MSHNQFSIDDYDLYDQSNRVEIPIPEPNLAHQPYVYEPLNNSKKIQFMMKCYPLAIYIPKVGEEDKVKLMECSNKIIAPASILQKVCQHNVCSEHIYQINKSKNRLSIELYYEYNEFNQMNNAIYVPKYIFEGLGIQYGDPINLDFINEVIPKGNYVKLQPVTNQIQEIDDYQSYMQLHLQSNYTCLIKGDTIRFPYFDDTIEMIIHDLKPSDIVSITNVNLSVDFEPSVEQREIEAKQQSELESKRLEELERQRLAELEKKRLAEIEAKKKEEYKKLYDKGFRNSFIPYQGKGHSLTGQINLVEPKDYNNNNNIKLDFSQNNPLNDTSIDSISEDKIFKSFEGVGHKLNSSSNPVSSNEDMRIRRLTYLQKFDKPKKQPQGDNIDTIITNEEEILSILKDDNISDNDNNKQTIKKPKRKKYKFTLKKQEKVPKPDFLP